MKKKLQNYFKLIDKPLLIVCLAMIVFGLLNIVTSSSREAITWEEGIYFYFYRQLFWLAISFVLVLFIINVSIKKYNGPVILAFIFLMILLIYAYIEPTVHRGSTRWITIGGFQFQPGEFAKPLIVLISAIMLDRYNSLIKRKPAAAQKVLNFTFIICLSIPALVFLQRDFGNAIIITSIFLFIFLISQVEWQKKINYLAFMSLMLVFLAGVAFFSTGRILEPHQIRRFEFLRPCINYEDAGYQICNAYIAINEGGLFGVGIGSSRQKYSYIDEPHTDMVFAIITEEYGAIVAGSIILIYTFILLRMIKIAREAKKLKLRYMAYGIMFYMFLQIFVNLGGLFGLIPLTGVTLPFLSYGGSFTIAFLISLAIIFRINIENRQARIKLKKI